MSTGLGECQYTGGTPTAQSCIQQLKGLDALVDVYSSEWLAANPDYGDFDPEDLARYQVESKGACAGHLLIISTSLHMNAVAQLLTAAYAPFADIFAPNGNHKPDFIFINLASQQILCVGLGRKNQIFGYAVGVENISVRSGNVYDCIQPWRNTIIEDPTLSFMRDFMVHDYAGIVGSLLEALYEFGECAHTWDRLPLTPDQIQEVISAGADSDGLYDIDDELMSLQEARALIQEFEETDETGKDNLAKFQVLFPDLSWGDLNTQDY